MRRTKPDPVVSSASILDAVQDTEAYLVANDDVIIVVFRGTREPADWATNLIFFTRDVPVAWGLSVNCNLHEVTNPICYIKIRHTSCLGRYE